MKLTLKSPEGVEINTVSSPLVDRGFDGYEVTLSFREMSGNRLVLGLERREAYDAAVFILESLGVARGRLEEIDRLMRKAHRP